MDQTPSLIPTITVGSVSISENSTRLYLCWLGVLFDKKLTFKCHVSKIASKALIVANTLRSLGNTVQGIQPYLT
jgi:hypothetical protein